MINTCASIWIEDRQRQSADAVSCTKGKKNIIKRQSRRRHLRVDFVYAHLFFCKWHHFTNEQHTHIHMIDICVTVTANVNYYFHVFREHTYEWRLKKRQMNEMDAIQIRPT